MAEQLKLENYEISKKALICLDLAVSVQPPTKKTNFDILSRKSPKFSCKTFYRKTHSTWFREFIYNPLSKINHEAMQKELSRFTFSDYFKKQLFSKKVV